MNDGPIATWQYAYDGHCPRCGGLLNPPDTHLDRRCPACALTIVAGNALIQWADPPPTAADVADDAPISARLADNIAWLWRELNGTHDHPA